MRRSLSAIAACLALALAGCGGDSSAGTDADAGTGGGTSATAAAAKREAPAPTRAKPTVKVPGGPPPLALVEKDLIVGKGAEARKGDGIQMQYVGYVYASGAMFAATSWRAGAPYHITLGDTGLTEGWNRGIEGMRVGGRRELIIPPRLGWGSERVGVVPPNSTLVYVIDLIAVE